MAVGIIPFNSSKDNHHRSYKEDTDKNRIRDKNNTRHIQEETEKIMDLHSVWLG